VQKNTGFIVNIDICKEYDAHYAADEVHYETFAGLAAFFGRDMQVHWHESFFQVHFLETGKIELQLDDQHYSVQAPLFILTPPSVPHAFFTEPDSDGHVLTVRQELVWPVLERLYPGSNLALELEMPGICLSLADAPQELAALSHYWELIRCEFSQKMAGREQTLALLAQALLTLLLRNTSLEDKATSGMRSELRLFQRFNKMVDERFREHLAVPEYAQVLGMTESRLNDLCRRFANRSPKRLIFDRMLREAKRMLLFSACTVHETAYSLGFKDPAYFARFFNRLEGCSPSVYRAR
jgi:AraC family 4-hydroxyphenylacetate 3-monooxygenase operon regulatory protein